MLVKEVAIAPLGHQEYSMTKKKIHTRLVNLPDTNQEEFKYSNDQVQRGC